MLKQLLHTGWTVRAASNLDEVPSNIRDRDIPAAVPGCVHTDLLRAGLIEDPYLDRNEAKVQWIGRTDWRFRTTFDVTDEMLRHERVDLACDGLDTIATLELNGQRVGDAANMFHPHRYDARRLLKLGRNELAITFKSAVKEVREQEARLGKLPWLNTPEPFNFIRKMACNFGWDWGPTLVTCGVWRPIRLEGWSHMQIKSVRPLVLSADANRVTVRVVAEFEGDALHASSRLTGPDGTVYHGEHVDGVGSRFETEIDVTAPQLWWPKGHGQQPLYELHVSANGEIWSGRVGLRTVELDTSPDEVGRKFVVKVNGKPIFCNGFNWVPDDCFLDRATTPERYRTRIQQALDANGNMLRVWGGGIYETDEFYDVCDELGVLVWQDFLFACAAYPEEEPFWSSVEREARYNVARLSRHPSLVVWNGCNENLWGYWDWGWKHGRKVEGRTWGAGYYLDLLPKVCAEVDPSRPYWAASPWSGDPDVENGLHPNLASHGNKHVWEAWFNEPYTAYRKFTPRFCSEFGFQGPPAYATFARAVPPEQRQFGSDTYKAHQKSQAGDNNNDRHLADFFETPANFDDRYFLLQLNQARALQLGVEWFRSRTPVCMGTLYWQLNDCWPVVSWSAIDGDGRFKPLYYATRRFYAPRLLTIHPVQDMYELCAVNDTDEPWRGEATLAMHHLQNADRRQLATVPLDVPPRSVGRIPLNQAPLMRPADRSSQFVAAQVGEHRALWFFEPDKKLNYPQPKLDATLSRTGDSHRLTVRAATFVRDLSMFVDRLDPDATISDQLVTLLPGESATFEIRSRKDLTKDALLAPPVSQCANRFGRRS
jgi:beta-mannosidase